MSMDNSEVRSLAAHLAAAPKLTRRQSVGIIHKGANNIKNQLREEMSRSRSFGVVAKTISYDVTEEGVDGGGIIEAEIGPNTHFKAARLENIAYFGTSRGGGTVPDPIGALLEELPRFEKAIADVASEAI